ncbi:MAG: cobyrinate a,c-diamide synthase [Verrucomicrobiia bacterium]|jgi:cobyrinic acid a,c-diamide synthase
MSIPRLVIAGTQSGVGKTSLTLGLVTLLRRRGLRVQTFKVGPDYLDPTYLALASDRSCYNLDGWMMGRSHVENIFRRVSEDADIAVIEGVMGLFDGADPSSSEGSTAEIARWLDAPVLLVVNAHGMARSLAAVVHGYADFDRKLRVAGVIANRCGSGRHARWLSESLKAAALPPLLGHIERDSLPELPSRHLGLVTADPANLSPALLDKLADALEAGLSLDAIMDAVRQPPGSEGILPASDGAENKKLHPEQSSPRLHSSFACAPSAGKMPALPGAAQPAHRQLRLGIARDEAFHFYYPDNLEALEQAGCELIPFSPLKDIALPKHLDGIYLGGGYPEEHAAALAANQGLLQQLRQFAAAGGLIYAECGGLMYLAQGIETTDGARHALLGLLPAWTRMCQRRKSLGYVEVTLTRDSLWGKRGERFRGHEFHYSELLGNPATGSEWQTAYAVQHRQTDVAIAEGFQRGRVLASYAHIHFASRPEAVRHFVARLAESPHTP